MSRIRIRLRPQAADDIRAIAFHYRGDSGLGIALGFADAIDRAFYQIMRSPEAGSDAYAHLLAIPGLRVWPLLRFPHVVFYTASPEEADVWRILNARRDIADWLRPTGSAA